MSILLSFDHELKLKTHRLTRSEVDCRPSYSPFPPKKGVYIFHTSPLEKIFVEAKNILYIGAANSSGIRERVAINNRGKIKQYCAENNIPLCSVYVSYFVIDSDQTSSLHFLIERLLIHEYQKEHTDLPACNRM